MRAALGWMGLVGSEVWMRSTKMDSTTGEWMACGGIGFKKAREEVDRSWQCVGCGTLESDIRLL